MLKAACRRYHRRLDRGLTDPHWRSCPACAHYTRTLRIARRAGRRPALPQRLRRRLRSVARPLPPVRTPLPLPALPAALELRLRRIPATATSPAPPASLRSAGPAIAASYLLMVALGLVLGNPYRIGEDVVTELARTTASAWSAVEERSTGVMSSVAATSSWARTEAELQRKELLSVGGELLDRARRLPASLDLPLPGAGREGATSSSRSTDDRNPNDREQSSLPKESSP